MGERLQGKVAIVTGAGSVSGPADREPVGNGKASAVLYSREGARVVAARIDARGDLDFDDFRSKLGPRAKMISVSHASNVLGTINPVGRVIALAKEHGVPVMIDGAQSAQHMHLDLDTLGADFYAFSGHKLYGPTGSGAGRVPWRVPVQDRRVSGFDFGFMAPGSSGWIEG